MKCFSFTRNTAAWGAVVFLLGRAVSAQTTPPGHEQRATTSDAETKARSHFKRASELFDQQEWREALAEYQQSLAYQKTKAAMASAAACLRALGQYDEALDMYEALRRDFPVLSANMEAKVAPAMVELQGLVGTLVVAGDVPTDASLFVDERKRGTVSVLPLRLTAGNHKIRLEKEPYEPIVAEVVIKPAQENVAQLQAKSKVGLLHVSEKHGWVLDVKLDGNVIGQTPWDGLVPSGEHTVSLHGTVRLDDEDSPTPGSVEKSESALDRTEMASTLSTVTVPFYEQTSLTQTGRDMDALLRVDATPAMAAVTIDDKVVGHGTWIGRLPLGVHTVEITAGGFISVKQQVRLERRKQPELRIALTPEPKPLVWGPKRRAAVGVVYGVGAAGFIMSAITGPLALSTNSAVRSRCVDLLCPESQKADLAKVDALATVSTVGLVVGAAGLVGGTLVAYSYRPVERDPVQSPTSGVTLTARAGLGRFQIEGSF